MQAFHLDTILSKGIKANRGFKTIAPLFKISMIKCPFSLNFFTITDISSRYKLASHSAAMTLPQVVIPFSTELSQTPAGRSTAAVFLHLFLRSLDTFVLVPPLRKSPSLSLL